ncbi:MAG TPA: phosphotransferase [Chthonomonadaceae bacterium]|nr:phosphotransferase [Chthonomonadaceae bacterium]
MTGLLWEQSAWQHDSRAWLAGSAAEIGRPLVGEIVQPRIRPWATLMHAPAAGGNLWFKASGPGLAHEAAITAALARWMPDATPRVLAHDRARSWLLMPDEGATLRDRMAEGAPGLSMHLAAERYANLQRELAPRRVEMLALGVPDCRLERLPRLYEDLLEDELLLSARDGTTDPPEVAQLRSAAPWVAALCAELAAYGLPETLQHDDLHSNNVFLRGEEPIIFDWGDSSISHPLFSLLVLLRGAARDKDSSEGSPAVRSLRDAFLAAWDILPDGAASGRLLAVATALARINRAIAWRRALQGVPEPYLSEFAPAVGAWLQEFLEAAEAL